MATVHTRLAQPSLALCLLALCAALGLPAAAGTEGEPTEVAWDDDDACLAGASPASCSLSLRQLRAHGTMPLATAKATEEAPRAEVDQEPPALDDVPGDRGEAISYMNGDAAEEPSEAGGLPGGWGEAANYMDEVATEANKTTEATLGRGWGSCAAYGCISYYSPGLGCQCNGGCQRHGNCCGDYWSRCHHHHHHHHHPHPAHGRNVKTLFHQTSPQACNIILKSNFHPGSRGWCGGGIYFATSPAATNTKAIGPDSHKGCILQAQVDVGRVMYLSKTCNRGLTGNQVWAKGYNSVSFDPGDGQEYIVYSSRQVLSIRRAR